MVKRHTKPTQRNPQGGIIEKEGRSTSRTSRSGAASASAARARASVDDDEGQKKRRVCVKCGTVVRDRVEEFGMAKTMTTRRQASGKAGKPS